MVCKIFQMCLTLELFYHGIYFGTKVLLNMLGENFDFMSSSFLLKIIPWSCYQSVFNLSFYLSLLFQGCGYFGCTNV